MLTKTMSPKKISSHGFFRRNSSDFDFSVQGESFMANKPKERFPVEDLIEYLTNNNDEFNKEDPDLSDFEEMTAEVLMLSHDPELLRIAKEHGWTGSRYNSSGDTKLDVGSFLQALSNFYLKINTPVVHHDVYNIFGKAKPDAKTKALDQIIPHSPDLLVDYFREHPQKLKPSDAISINFKGACMLADISGFSKFSGAMCSKGVSGLDDLREATNGFLGHFVKTVYHYDGDVIEFAGDALVCVFPDNRRESTAVNDEGEPINDACYRALQCACVLRTHQAMSLSTHIGVSCGEMKMALLGGLQDQWVYLMNGMCVCDLAGCIEDAGPQQVAATSECFKNASDWMLHLRKTVCPLLSDIEVVKHTETGNVLVDNMFIKGSTTADGTPTVPYPYETVPEKEYGVVEGANKNLYDLVACFVPKPVLLAVNSESLEHIGELRSVTTMFLSLDSYDSHLHHDPVSLQPFFLMAQTALVEAGGFCRQFLVDDKGCVFIAMWGTPSFTYSNNCSRALHCAATILSKCEALGHKVSIGITTGIVYCSTVGAFQRRDYAGIGTDVNMAARLMCKAKGRVLLDTKTYGNLSQENKELLVKAETMTLKGMEGPITPWAYINNPDADQLPRMVGLDEQTSEQSTIVKKRVKLCIGEQLDKLTSTHSTSVAQMDPEEADKRTAYFTFILGLPGTGKTVTAQYFRHHARKRNIQCIFIQAHAEGKGLPYGLMRQLFNELVGADNFATESQQRELVDSLVQEIASEARPEEQAQLRFSLEVILGLEELGDKDNGSVSSGGSIHDSHNASDYDLFSTNKHSKKRVSSTAFYTVLTCLLGNTPTVLIVENAHFCDELSWNQLQTIQTGTALNLVVLITMLSSSAMKRDTGLMRDDNSVVSDADAAAPVVEKLSPSTTDHKTAVITTTTTSGISVNTVQTEASGQSGGGGESKDQTAVVEKGNGCTDPTDAESQPVSLKHVNLTVDVSHPAPVPSTENSVSATPVSVPASTPSNSATSDKATPTSASGSVSDHHHHHKSGLKKTNKYSLVASPRASDSAKEKDKDGKKTPMRPTLSSFAMRSGTSNSTGPKFLGRETSVTSNTSAESAKYGLKYQPTVACISMLEHPDTVILEMSSLNEGEIRAILLHTLKVRDISRDLVRLVMDVCSGNAFWCKAIANFIKERDIAEFEKTIKQGQSPQNALKVLVLCRMEKLEPGPQIILKHASIIGDEFSEKQLAAVVPSRYLSSLTGHLDFLCEHGFILCTEEFPEQKFSFQNQLIHDTIYELMPPKEASALHLIVAEYLEVKYGDNLRPYYPRLGYHYSNSGPEMRDQAFKYELKAADQALSRGAYVDGLGFTRKAFKQAQEIPEFQVLVEVVNGAIEDMTGRNKEKERESKASMRDGEKPRLGQLLAVAVALQNIVSAAESKTIQEYQRIRKDAEVAIVKLQRIEVENGREAKVAALRSGRPALTWQPSYIASRRSEDDLADDEDDDEDDEEEEGGGKKDTNVKTVAVKQCCVIA